MYSKPRKWDKVWVIPSCDARLTNIPVFDHRIEPVHYWTVELTLTSGRVLKFYIKAKTKWDAIEIAQNNLYRADIPPKKDYYFIL